MIWPELGSRFVVARWYGLVVRQDGGGGSDGEDDERLGSGLLDSLDLWTEGFFSGL